MAFDPSNPLIDMYVQLCRIRAFEETTISLFRQGAVPGFSHSYIGQEAVAVGVCSALRTRDRITSTHRGHGHILAKGGDPARMLAEIMGKATGYCKGKSGELHIMDFAIGVLGTNGIVGAGIPIAAGAALADRLAGRDTVTACFFGDGATSEGDFAEGLNLAAVWSLPVVFVCENNLYGEFTAAADACAGKIHERAIGYGIPGVVVDGQNVQAVYETAEAAVQRARSGAGPTLVEAFTYRWHGHFYGEEALVGTYTYRPTAEVTQWRNERDPIALARARCLAENVANEARLTEIVAKVADEMQQAKRFAEESPSPAPEEAMTELFWDGGSTSERNSG